MSDHNAKQDTALSQSAERMTPDKFFTEWSNRHGGIEAKMQDWPFRFAEAYAEHCTAALTAKLAEVTKQRDELAGLDESLGIEVDADGSLINKAAESSAALVKELAKALQKWQQFSKDCIPSDAAGMDELTGYDRLTESLLSDPAVKKVLEK